MIQDGRRWQGGSSAEDQAKIQDDEKLHEEHESVSQAQEELEEVSHSESESRLQPQA